MALPNLLQRPLVVTGDGESIPRNGTLQPSGQTVPNQQQQAARLYTIHKITSQYFIWSWIVAPILGMSLDKDVAIVMGGFWFMSMVLSFILLKVVDKRLRTVASQTSGQAAPNQQQTAREAGREQAAREAAGPYCTACGGKVEETDNNCGDCGKKNPLDKPVPAPEEPVSAEKIHAMYVQVSKLVHPDLVKDEKEKARRTELMRQANMPWLHEAQVPKCPDLPGSYVCLKMQAMKYGYFRAPEPAMKCRTFAADAAGRSAAP